MNIEEVAPPPRREDYTDLQWGKIWQANEKHKRWERLRLGIKDMQPDDNAPTEQTIRKLHANVIEKLHKNKTLTNEHVGAAEEILNVWEALGRGMWTGRQEPGNRVDGGGKWADPIDRMSEAEGVKFSTHYAPWMREAERVIVPCRRPPGQPLTAAIITWDIVVNNNGPSQIINLYGMRKGAATRWLQRSLFRYAEIAGRIHPAQALGVKVWENVK